MKLFPFTLGILFLLFNFQIIFAQTTTKVITTAVPFLLINPEGASLGMGQTGLATQCSGLGAILNPAKMAFQKRGIMSSSTVAPYYPSGFYGATGLSISLNEKQTLGIQYRTLSAGVVNLYDEIGTSIGWSKPVDRSVSFSYAYKISEHFSIGANLALLGSYLRISGAGFYFKNIQTLNAGIGAYYQNEYKSNHFKMEYAVGSAITNMGPKVSYTVKPLYKDFQPANWGFGAALRMRFGRYFILNPALDFNKLLVPSLSSQSKKSAFAGMLSSGFDAEGGLGEEIKEVNVSSGLETGVFIPFNQEESSFLRPVLRMGYFNQSQIKGNRKFLTLGLGTDLQIQHFYLAGNVNLALPTVPNQVLPQTLSVNGSLGYLF